MKKQKQKNEFFFKAKITMFLKELQYIKLPILGCLFAANG